MTLLKHLSYKLVFSCKLFAVKRKLIVRLNGHLSFNTAKWFFIALNTFYLRM